MVALSAKIASCGPVLGKPLFQFPVVMKAVLLVLIQVVSPNAGMNARPQRAAMRSLDVALYLIVRLVLLF